MSPWEREFFKGTCPYTDKFCTTDIKCSDCEVNDRMSRQDVLKHSYDGYDYTTDKSIEVVKQPIDKSAMMYEIYMKGVNMTDEYQGCWVRFKDIEEIVDKYITESEE